MNISKIQQQKGCISTFSHYNITTSLFHLRSEQQKVEDDVGSAQLTSYIVMSQIVNGMSILVATFVVFLVKESSVKAKHIQFVSGVHSFNFWLSTYLWDLVNYFIPAVIIVPVLAAFDMPGTTGFDAV